MLIPWTNEMAIGHAEIDRDHQTLVEIVNRLHEAMLQGHGREVLTDIFNRLARYTHEHFAREEELMRRIGYADLQQHKQRHAELLRQLTVIAARHGSGELEVTIETMTFLKDWLTIHIQKEDAKLADALRA